MSEKVSADFVFPCGRRGTAGRGFITRLAVVVNRALLAAAASLVFTLSACGPAARPTPAPVAPVRAPLAEDDVRPAAELVRLEDRRDYAHDRLDALAGHPSAEIRARTALTLGRLQRVAGLPVLARLLVDADTAVAANAAFALGQLGDTSAVPALVEVLVRRPGPGYPPAAEAAHALGKLRSETASAALLSVLGESEIPAGFDAVIGEALLAVWRHPRGADPAPLLRWTAAPDPELRWRAAYALTRRPDPAATSSLLRLASDFDARVRAHAVRGLTGPLADSAGVPRPAVVDALFQALDDPDYATRINAIRTLGTLEGAAVVSRLESFLDGGAAESIAAAESLGRIGGPAVASAPRLGRLASDPRAPTGARIAAVTALAQIRPADGGELAERLASNESWRIRAAAGRTLAQWAAVESAGFRALVRDPDPRVAASTLQAAVDNVQIAPASLRLLLIEALGSPDAGLRTAALRGLARLAEPATLSILVDAYGTAFDDTSSGAALAALDALAALHAKGAPAANTLFRRFARPEDYLIRLRAERHFGDAARAAWGVSLPIETGRALQDYEALVERFVRRPSVSGEPLRAVIVTEAGEIDIELFAPEAPLTVENFLRLARSGYFNGQEWPRVVPNFVIQGGDPRGDQSGGPGYAIRDEINRHRYGAGTVGMALSGPDTGGSQFFVTHSPQPHLDGGYTVFGRILSDADIVERVMVGERIMSIRALGAAEIVPQADRE